MAPMTPPRASLATIGCRLNQAETALLADRLRQRGYRLVAFGQPTDLLVLNTCAVTDQAEADCRYLIRRTLRRSPRAFIAVTGCYAQTNPEAIRRLPGVDLILGAQYKMALPEYLPPAAGLRKRPGPELLHTRTLAREEFDLPGVGDYATTRANLKVQDGCNFMCSFCLIPFARGRERSRRAGDVLREAEALAARGHRELVLTGVNIGHYASEGLDLAGLIRRLEAIAGVDRIRISSIEPTTITEPLLERLATSPRLCRHLHIPLQSGDDEVLAAMNRRYRAGDYRTLIERVLRLVPDLGLGTDLMVGFPGETDRQFANTVALAKDLPFSYLHVFSYAERPGTAAARLADRVPERTVKARSRMLAELSRAKRLAFCQRRIGRRVRVLVERREGDGLWTGLTDDYLRVGLASPDDLTNRFVDIVVTGAMDGLAIGRLAAEGAGR